MADNITVANSASSSQADYTVRTREKDGKHAEVVVLDIGEGDVEDLTAGAVLSEMVDLLTLAKEYLKSIADPVHVDRALNRARVTALIESGTITTVSTVTTCSTVTTVTGLTNIDGYQGKMSVIADDLNAWALVCRARIS